MALKDLLVYVDQTEGALERLRLAVDLASRHSSRLAVLYVREWSPPQQQERGTAELGLVSAHEFVRMERRIEASIEHAGQRLRSTLETLGRERDLQTEWRCVDGRASTLVPQHARCADLCIVGTGASADRDSVESTFSQDMLFVTGRPVLFIPASRSVETLGRHVAVAWNSSLVAMRAMNDALPLIEHAERATVLTANPAHSIDKQGYVPAQQLVGHLQRHNSSVSVVQLNDVPAGSIADALQAQARALGADLMVAGAFGQAKLREKLLGGVTCDLLARMRLPIFMSH